MITIHKDDAGNPHVNICVTQADIESDRKNEGIEHTPISTTAHGAVRFLESLQELSPDSILQIESLLTAVYMSGFEAGAQQHRERVLSVV